MSSISDKASDLKPQGFTLQRKIITGFSGLMILLILCIAITLDKLASTEKLTISVIEHQQPSTILVVSLSEDLNLAISLLSEYLLSGIERDIADYPLVEQRLFVYLEKIVEIGEKSSGQINIDSIVKLKYLLDKFSKLGKNLIQLRDDSNVN